MKAELPGGWGWVRGRYSAKRADGALVVQRMGNMDWWYAYRPNDPRPFADPEGGPIRFRDSAEAIRALEEACPTKST